MLGRSVNHGRARFTRSAPDDPDDLPGPIPPEEQDTGPFYANQYATITAIGPAKDAPTAVPNDYAQTIYVGTDTGRVWKTERRGRALDEADRACPRAG